MFFFKKIFKQKVKRQNNAPSTIDYNNTYRNRFKHSLTGKWSSVEGTFSIQSDKFDFFENRNGYWLSQVGSYENKISFTGGKNRHSLLKFKQMKAIIGLK